MTNNENLDDKVRNLLMRAVETALLVGSNDIYSISVAVAWKEPNKHRELTGVVENKQIPITGGAIHQTLNEIAKLLELYVDRTMDIKDGLMDLNNNLARKIDGMEAQIKQAETSKKSASSAEES